MHSLGVFLQFVLSLELLRAKVALELPAVTVTEHMQAQFILTRKGLFALRTRENLL